MSTISLLTFADFEQMADAPGKQELIDGELIEMPPAKFRRMFLSKRLFGLLSSGATGSLAYFEMGYLIGSPELAVEVLSPRNRASHIERKLTLYFAEGASEVWVIDPSNYTMLVYRATPEGVIRTAVTETYQSKYPAITLSELFKTE